MRLLEVARRGAVAIIIYSLFRFSQYPLFPLPMAVLSF
nr:MAG TPA: hypothetical protein [Caudoviricetes sp.]